MKRIRGFCDRLRACCLRFCTVPPNNSVRKANVGRDGEKVAVLLHLYYTDLWPEFRCRLRNVVRVVGDDRADLFVTLSEAATDHSVRAAILRAFPSARVEVVPNRGLDIGPFLLWVQSAYAEGYAANYRAVLKLHTKKSLHSVGPSRGLAWRRGLVDAIAGTPEQVRTCLRLLDSPGVGMVGAASALSRSANANATVMKLLSEWLGIPGELASEPFFAGTMFWVRMGVLQHFLTPDVVTKLYACMPPTYSSDGTVAHAVERILGHMVPACGHELVGVNAPTWTNR